MEEVTNDIVDINDGYNENEYSSKKIRYDNTCFVQHQHFMDLC